MKTYRLLDNENNMFAFEIENTFISKRRIVKLLRANPNVSEVHSQSSFFGFFARPLSPETDPDVRIKFTYKDNKYIVWEPFGDNSGYWIGSEGEDLYDDISEIEEIFINHVSPSWIASIFVLAVATAFIAFSVMRLIEAYKQDCSWRGAAVAIVPLVLGIAIVYVFIKERWGIGKRLP